SIQYQNANNSVRVTDVFMEAATEGREFNLTARTDGGVVSTVEARDLLRQIAAAAWECADPGVQYDTTINSWHTLPNTGRINASNPCSEYMSIDDSACNLASLNLMKFRREDGEFDVEAFEHAVVVVFLAQEILVGYSSYPTPEIERNAKAFRQLGRGSGRPADGVPEGVGRRARRRRDPRLPQRAGNRARADRDDQLHDGLRHDRRGAGLLARQVEEARRRRRDHDRQQDRAHGAPE